MEKEKSKIKIEITNDLFKLIEQSHGLAKDKGFWEDGEKRNVPEMLALIHAEISESLEALRKDKRASKEQLMEIMRIEDDGRFKYMFQNFIKDTFEDEIADTTIRLFDLAGGKDINLLLHICGKLRYNSMREAKHGKKF